VSSIAPVARGEFVRVALARAAAPIAARALAQSAVLTETVELVEHVNLIRFEQDGRSLDPTARTSSTACGSTLARVPAWSRSSARRWRRPRHSRKRASDGGRIHG
jgi:hypothetical protein